MPPPLPPGYLSPHFSLHELTFSQTAVRLRLANTPGPEALANLYRTATMLEDVRALLGVPVIVSSGYRAPAVNAAAKGAADSAHLLGLAADFIAPAFGTPLDICRRIQAAWQSFDQLIYEGGWVHLGLSPRGVAPRREVLTAVFHSRGKPTYQKGLIE